MWCVTILSSLAIGRNAQGRVASPRRPRFVVGGLGTPVRSEIGPYQTLAEGATMPQAPEAFFGCGYAALGTMQASEIFVESPSREKIFVWIRRSLPLRLAPSFPHQLLRRPHSA